MLTRNIRRTLCTSRTILNTLRKDDIKIENSNKIVYLSQLPYDLKKEQLLDIFKRYGPIKEIHLPKKVDKDHIKGYGKILFEDEKNARRASIQMQGYVINNIPIKLRLGSQSIKRKELNYDVVILRNLSYESTEEEIMEILRPYQALRIGLSRSPVNNECLGHGYVRFASPDAAKKAVNELKNLVIRDRKIKIFIAEPKSHHYKFIV